MGASDALAGRAESVIAETIALARVPAPPLDEAQRADFVRRGLADSGLRVSTGAMGNVLAALLALARQFAADAVPAPAPLHLLFLFSVGEEGEGNLAGRSRLRCGARRPAGRVPGSGGALPGDVSRRTRWGVAAGRFV